MAIPFSPPDWLIQQYVNRKQPAEMAGEALKGGLDSYAAIKQRQEAKQQTALDQYLKAFQAGGPQLAADVAKRSGLQNPPALPGASPAVAPVAATVPEVPDVASQMSNEASAQQSLPPPSPVIAHWQATMGNGGAPASAPTPSIPGLEDPTALVNMGDYGKNRLQAGEALGKFQQSMSEKTTKAEENAPKSFDYARAFAKNAGAPNAADDFIGLAQKEGRDKLTKREIDDLKNSIATSAQTGRGEYLGQMAGINEAKFKNQLLQEGNKALNPNVAGGALKPQQERLNRIGRADALVQQMASQAGGGDTRQMRELATSLASVLTGGNVVAEQQINELVPKTYRGNYQKFLEKLTNNPTGLEQQEFVKRLSDTLAREKGTINTQIKGAQQAALPGLAVLKQRNPKGYKAVVDSNMNNPQYQTTPTVASQEEYDVLPSGSEYHSADGVLHRKK